MSYIAWCRLPVRPGTLSQAMKSFEAIMHYVDDEPGTLDYVANIDDSDLDAIWVYERYQDEAASLAHRKSDWLQKEFKPKSGEANESEPSKPITTPMPLAPTPAPR